MAASVALEIGDRDVERPNKQFAEDVEDVFAESEDEPATAVVGCRKRLRRTTTSQHAKLVTDYKRVKHSDQPPRPTPSSLHTSL